MGFLSKVWKGIKKTVKKIGKGIKKVVKGFSKAIGKLGVVGQLGMMFLMPYAFNALGGWIGQAGTWMSKTAGNLIASSNPIGQALGHTMNLVHTVGTKVGDAYNSITSTISGAVNSFADFTGLGKGYDAIGEFFHNKVVNPTKEFLGFETSTYNPLFADNSGVVRDGDVKPKVDTTKTIDTTKVETGVETGIPKRATTEDRLKSAIEIPDVKPPKVPTTPEPPSLLQKKLSDAAFKGVSQRLQEGIYQELGGELPDYRSFSSSYNFQNLSTTSDSSVVAGADLFLQNNNGNLIQAHNMNGFFDTKSMFQGINSTFDKEAQSLEEAMFGSRNRVAYGGNF